MNDIAAQTEALDAGSGLFPIGRQRERSLLPEKFRHQFKVAGDVLLDSCPLCNNEKIETLWQFPQTALKYETHLYTPGAEMERRPLTHLPLLDVPQPLFCYDICAQCQMIFRNPQSETHSYALIDSNKVAATPTQEIGYLPETENILRHYLPQEAPALLKVVGKRDHLFILVKEKDGYPEFKASEAHFSLVPGTDIIFFRDLQKKGFESYFPEDSADFILFLESFAYLGHPISALQQLTRMLRSGGHLYFTAPYYGPKAHSQIGLEEPLFISDPTRDWILQQLPCKLIDCQSYDRMHLLLEKM